MAATPKRKSVKSHADTGIRIKPPMISNVEKLGYATID
jgi:hypothetical protein